MLSRSAIHAVRALSYLAIRSVGEFTGAAELAKSTGAPRNYLGKLLQTLAVEGLLESRKGTGGGFRLARSSQEISIFDVVEPIDRVSAWQGCFLGRSSCSDDQPCTIHTRWADLRNRYIGFLTETSIADLSGGDPAFWDLSQLK